MLTLCVTAIPVLASYVSPAAESASTDYGTVPSANAGNTFVLFDGDKNFLSGADTWRAANAAAKEWLDNNPGKTVNILLQEDHTVTATVGSNDWLGHMNGEVIYDLNGNTIIADAVLFDTSIYSGYEIPESTTITVKNGTLLQGKDYIFYSKNDALANKEMSLSFDNVTFGFHAATALDAREIMFRAQGTLNGGNLTLSMTFNGCTFDVSAFPASGTDASGKAFTGKPPYVFFGDKPYKTTNVKMNVKVYGGEFIVGALNKIVIAHNYALPGVMFYPTTTGEWATISVINGEKTDDIWVPTELGDAAFSKLVSDGPDRDVYALQTYEQIVLENLLYVEYNGERLYKAPFYIPTGATYNAVYLDAERYEGMLTTESSNSIRLSESAGLRFATRIDAELLDELYALLEEGALDSVEFGTLIAPTDYVADELTMAKMAAAGKAYLRIIATYNDYFDYDTDDTTTHFVGSIVNLYEHNVDRPFFGRGYVKIVPNIGETIVLYSEHTQKADVQSVAKTFLNERPEYVADLSTAHKEILEQFAAGFVPPVDEETEADRKLHGLNVLAIGDSLFYGPEMERHEQWIALLARECNWNLTNLGQGGWTLGHKTDRNHMSMSYQLLNNPNYVYGSTSYYNMGNTTGKSAEDVDLIFLEGGFNDWGQNVPLGTPTSTDINTMLGAMNVIIERLKVVYPNATIVLITSWHLEGSKTLNGEAVDYIDYTAGGMKSVYETNYKDDPQIKLIDAGDPALTDIHMYDPDWRAVYSNAPNDACHLNAKGMEIMAEHMLPLLKETILSPVEQLEVEAEP